MKALYSIVNQSNTERSYIHWEPLLSCRRASLSDAEYTLADPETRQIKSKTKRDKLLHYSDKIIMSLSHHGIAFEFILKLTSRPVFGHVCSRVI